MKFHVHKKETTYFAIMCVISLATYVMLGVSAYLNPAIIPIVLVYAGIFCLISKLGALFLLGHLKGNAVKIEENQLPEIHAVIKQQAMMLGLDTIPQAYIWQGNGLLNAFAVRLAKKDFVILFSDVLEVAYQEGADVVAFIIGHELGHIKRKHTGFLKRILTLPASFIPFLSSAYSRAREYTCDNIGCVLAPKGAAKGLLLLGAGKKLYNRISVEQLLASGEHNKGFATGFAEIFSTHPHLLKRIEAVREQLGDDVFAFEKQYVSPQIKETYTSEQL